MSFFYTVFIKFKKYSLYFLIILLVFQPYHVFLNSVHSTYINNLGIIGDFEINNDANTTPSTAVVLNMNLTGVIQMRFGNTPAERDTAPWEAYTTIKNWTLTNGSETKTIYAEFENAGGTSIYVQDEIILEFPSPTLWYDASDIGSITEAGGSVSQWNDKSGNNYHLKQNDNTRQAELLATNEIDFNGNSDFFYIENLNYVNTKPLDGLLVCTVFRTANTSTGLTGNWSFLDFDRSEWFNFFNRGSDIGFSYDSDGTIRDIQTSGIPVNDNNWHVSCASYDNSITNDTLVSIDGSIGFNGDIEPNGAQIGSGQLTRFGFVGDGSEAITENANRNNAYYDGTMGEILLFDRAISTTERQKIECDLGNKWGISMSGCASSVQGPIASVEYTPETTTPGSVTASITNESEFITITNNGGSRNYTFTENGSFTFQFIDSDGNTGSVTAVVDWIVPIPKTFITTWKTDNAGSSSNTQITIPTTGIGYNYSIDCNGDGIPEAIGVTGDYTCSYPTPGIYTVEISGDFPRIFFNNNGDILKILSINQWGDIEWTSMANAFFGAKNLDMAANDQPNLSNVTSMQNMFLGVEGAFSGDMTSWDVSNVIFMGNMFFNTISFNQNISNWNTKNVIDMQGMFFNADGFNTPITTTAGGWNTQNVKTFQDMFTSADLFNQDVSTWDTGSAINMSGMFQNADSFNLPITTTLGGWNTNNVTDFSFMFRNSDLFNQDVSTWDTGSAVNMSGMFQNAKSYDQDLASFNITEVTDMTNMLSDSRLSISNYDNTLISWNSQTPQTGVTLGSIGLTYCTSETARTNLVSIHNWNITGDMICNTPPTDIGLSNTNLDENIPPNSVLGTLSSVDIDSGDIHTYSLVSGAGDTDNSFFTITGNTLSINISPDFETQDTYSIRVQTQDGNGGIFNKIFNITINDIDEVIPVISSTNIASGSILPGGNHNIIINYSDAGSGINTTSANIELYKWDGVSSYGVDIAGTNISTNSVSTTTANYSLNNLSFGKYQYIFSVSDIEGNTTTEIVDFYIDEPEFIVSDGLVDIGDIYNSTASFSNTVTLTVKTVGSAFDISMNMSLPSLIYTTEGISPWDGNTGFGFSLAPYTSISTIGTNQLIATQVKNININGNKNIYTYDLKLGALVEIQQASGNYMGNIDFGIKLEY